MLQIKRYKAEDLNATAYDPAARKSNTVAEASQVKALKDRQITNQVRKEAQRRAEAKLPKPSSEKPKTSSERYIRAKTERVQETQRAKAKKTQPKKPGSY